MARYCNDAEFSESLADFCRSLDAIGAALDPAERTDPRSITTARTAEIEAAANMQGGEFAFVLRMFDFYQQIARERRWWEPHPDSPIYWIGLPALVVALGLAVFLLTAYLIS